MLERNKITGPFWRFQYNIYLPVLVLVMEAIKKDAYKYAVKNAFLHEGKADVGAVIGKIMALHKGIDLKKAMHAIQEAVKQVNEMPQNQIEKEFKKFEKIGYELKPKQKQAGLPELPWAGEERVVTRFAPNPNGPIHFGHARAAVLSYEYAKKYNGEFFLRFDDTDPRIKKPLENAEEVFRRDLEWLGIKIEKVVFASDRLEIYYDYMRKLLEMEKAYVCKCSQSQWKRLVTQKKPCKHRKQESKESLALFEKMLSNELGEGEAVVRIKTDLKHNDPSVRDWWIARIINTPNHPRTGSAYHVWPSYMFQSAIDDHLLGATLILRGQEHAQNKTKQEFLYNYFRWQYPHSIHFGRLKLGSMMLSTSKILAGIQAGKYESWDDPRLGTIAALRRRGFQAEAIKQAIIEVGTKPSDANIEMSKLADINKHLIEENAERIPFVLEPIELDVGYALETEAELDGKTYELHAGNQKFLVDKKEMEKTNEGNIVRIRNAYNAKIVKKNSLQVFAEFAGKGTIDAPIISWVIDGIDVEIVTPENRKTIGTADSRIKEKQVDEIVYLEKFGFARVDSTNGRRIVLYFAHK